MEWRPERGHEYQCWCALPGLMKASALTNSVYVTLLRIDQGTGRRFDSNVKKRANENLWAKKDN